MKTIVVIGVLAVVAYFCFRSLFQTMTGKKGCGCSSGKSGCPLKGKCPGKK